MKPYVVQRAAMINILILQGVRRYLDPPKIDLYPANGNADALRGVMDCAGACIV